MNPVEFESQLIQNLKGFIQHESFMLETTAAEPSSTINSTNVESGDDQKQMAAGATKSFAAPFIQGVEEEIKFIEKAEDMGVVYMLGEADVMAHPNSTILTKIVVNYAYSFLRNNFRQGENLMAIPRNRSLLKVGMTYEI